MNLQGSTVYTLRFTVGSMPVLGASSLQVSLSGHMLFCTATYDILLARSSSPLSSLYIGLTGREALVNHDLDLSHA